MDITPTYWEENSSIQRVKYESCGSHEESSRIKDERGVFTCCDTNLNFSTATCSEDDCDFGPYKKNKITRQDPMSHRIIEKRRRDRMNNCLADLSRLIPTEYLKKGRGRIEKTEIIEMAIKYMKCLQQDNATPSEHYRLGYQECMSEVMRFMVEVEGHFPREAVCVRLLNHLQKHCESISRTGPAFDPDRHCSGVSVPVPNASEADTNGSALKGGEYAGGKIENEPNNNSNSFVVRPAVVEDPPKMEHSPDLDYEKQQPESNGMLYKYKTNIKMRFSQDLNGGGVLQDTPKRQKLENGRRTSLTSVENQSLSHSSPSSEPCHLRSPSDSTSSTTNKHLTKHHRLSSPPPRDNFNIPIFVLHSKGSYYVPLTIDYKTLTPFLHNYDIFDVAQSLHVLHPVTINVDFCPPSSFDSAKYKSEYNNNWH